MLINKSVVTGDVVSFRLVSGEELVGSFRELNTKGYLISKPVVIAMHQTGPQQAQLAFAPFMASVDEDQPVTFPEAALVIRPTLCRKDIADNYRRITSSVAIPTASEAAALNRTPGGIIL